MNKNTLKRSLLLALCGVVLASMPLAMARWKLPIRPGDHVFDAKRYIDSVKETAEMVKNVQNSYEKLRSSNIYNLGANIEAFERAYNAAATNINEMSSGNTFININKDAKDAESYKYRTINDAVNDNGEIERSLRNEATARKLAELNVMSAVQKNTTSREAAINNIINENDDGVLAEHQKANAVAILEGMTEIDAIRQRSALFVDELQDQEEAFAAERLEEQKRKQAVFQGYDPYNPTEEQAASMQLVSKDLGFITINR